VTAKLYHARFVLRHRETPVSSRLPGTWQRWYVVLHEGAWIPATASLAGRDDTGDRCGPVPQRV